MRQHPFLGAKILMESEGVPDLAINVAYGHHIFHNGAGRGYPSLKGEVKLDPVTELIKVIDFYEAVTAKRPYKKPMLPELAASLIALLRRSETAPLAPPLNGNRWGLGEALGPPEAVSASPAGESAGANGRDSWVVTWEQVVYLPETLPTD